MLVANDGHEAIGIIDSDKYDIDIIVTDLTMPDQVSGLDVAEKALNSNPSIKVVMASGYDTKSENYVLDNMRGKLSNPFTKLDLLTKVRKVLDED